MKLRVIGCGDAFGSGGRANTCFYVEGNFDPFLIDCGASALIELKKYKIDPDTIGTIVISHLHGDHFGGLVFLLREATLYKKRTRALTVAGPPGLEKRLHEALEVFFPGASSLPTTFDLRLIELPEKVETRIDHLLVTPFPVIHPCGAVPYALRVNVNGTVIAYSADTIWVDNLIECGRNADLFICEAYTWENPMGSHLDYQTVRRQLPVIQPKRVLLTHLGPELIARLDMLEHEIAFDGRVIEIA